MDEDTHLLQASEAGHVFAGGAAEEEQEEENEKR